MATLSAFPGEVHAFDILPASTPLLAALRLGVGAALDLVVPYGCGLDTSARLTNGLLNVGAFAIGKGLHLLYEHKAALADADASDSGHQLIGVRQQLELTLRGDGEGVYLDGCGISPLAGYGGSQVHLFLAEEGRGFSDLDSQVGYAVYFRKEEVVA